MAKVVSLLSRILALVLFALSWTRVAVGRILPSLNPPQEPRGAKVFALTEAEWNDLRAGRPVAAQEKSEPKSGDSQQDTSKGGDQAKDSAKSEEKKDQEKSADCDKAAPKPAEDKAAPGTDDKKKDASKPGECGPGGGDGDMAGGGG